MKIRLVESDNAEHVSLQSIIDVNAALNSIIKRAYKNVNGISDRKKVPDLKIYASGFKDGSFIEELSLARDIVQDKLVQASFAIMSLNLAQVFEVVKLALEARQLFSKAKKNGHQVTLDVKAGDNSPILIVNNFEGRTNLEVSDSVFKTMKDISSAGTQLTGPLRRGELKAIELETASKLLRFDEEDGGCFSGGLDVTETTITIVGNVYSFDKDKKTGRVSFLDALEGREKRLKFKIVTDGIVMNTIESMKKTLCKIHCLEEYISGPDGKKNVISLLITKIEPI